VEQLNAITKLHQATEATLKSEHDATRQLILGISEARVQGKLSYDGGLFMSLTFVDNKFSRIAQWLSAPDPLSNYQAALKQREVGTGQWYLQSKQHTRWKCGKIRNIWLHGIPGCGKSILSSTILEDITGHCGQQAGHGVSYFFFDFNDPLKQLPELMIRSLVAQLIQQCGEIPTGLEAQFTSSQRRYQQLSLEVLLEALKQLIKHFTQCYIVLDALDECKDLPKLMEVLEQWNQWSTDNLHVLYTSRKEHDIENVLERFVDKDNMVCLQSDIVDKDIDMYVRRRLSQDKDLIKWQRDPALREEIETTLINGAHGM
jgi:NACHT domain-containing protein